jgi:hypothetical protein
MKRLLVAGLLLFSFGLAQSVPLTRYFPDGALATLELNDLQGAVEQTGQFGEETIRTLTQLAGTSLQSLSEELSRESGVGALSNLGVRALVGALRDASLAFYSGSQTAEPLVLAVAKVGQFGPIGQLIRAGFNESLKNPRLPRLREGQFVALRDDDIWFGLQDGLVYASNSPDLLRGYLRRVRGQNLPVLTTGTAYKAVMDRVGPGWSRYFVNFSALAQWLRRSPEAREVPVRFFNALRTLNLHGGAQRLTTAGVENRTISVLNPNGGEAELYRLLTYNPERLELTAQLPAQTSGTAIFALDTAGWLDYIGGWAELAEMELDQAAQFRQVLGELKNYLGNEFGVSTTGNGLRALANSGMNFLTPLSISDDPTTAFISSITSSLNANILFAQVKDGPATLEVLEEAIRKQLENLSGDGTQQTLERIELAGSPALYLNTRINISGGSSGRSGGGNTPRQTTSFDFYLVAKGNVLWFGSDRAALEAGLNAPTLSSDASFGSQRWPSRVTGLNFALPFRIGAEEANNLINTLLGSLGQENAKAIPQNLRQIAVNYMVNWSNRTGVTTGHATVNGNRLQTFSLSEFRWGR